jgi:signal transduction histidine kinase
LPSISEPNDKSDVNEYIIIVIIVAVGMVMFLSVAATAICFRYQRAIERKDRGIMRQIREQDCLAKELERTRIENETLDRLLKGMLNGMLQPADTERDEKEQSYKYKCK